MKILQLSKYYPPAHGGLELVAEFFSRAVCELGHEVTVVSLGKETKIYTGRFGERVLESKEDLKLSSSPISLQYFLNARVSIQQNPPDLILLHLPHPFAHEVIKWFKTTIKDANIKLAGIYHSDIVNQVSLRDAYNLHFLRHQEIYDFFICSSPNLQKSSPILSLLPENRVKIIPFCIDHSFKARFSENVRDFQGRFISIGRMVPYKGYDFLIDCFNSLPYSLTLVGSGPLKAQLQKKAGSNIKFLGEVSEEEKFRLLQSHDALIMSSINRAEAYGMTIVEAFSVGLPVIASNVNSGVSFLVKDEATGLKFPIKDFAGLSLQIEKLKNCPGLAKKLSEGGMDFFNRELSYEAFMNNFKSLIASVDKA